MKISVIIPVYKVEPYIRQCIESVMAQTMTDIEIIVVNDGTPDRSAEIAKEYAAKDNRIKVIDQENQGVSAARNAGLRAASAPLVMFVDSDDWVTPDYCQKMFDALTDDVDVAMCAALSISDEPGPDGAPYTVVRGRWLDIPCSGSIKESNVAPWNKIFRLEIIRRHNIEFPEGCTHEDAYFWDAYMPWCRGIVFVYDKLYVYRSRRPGGITHNVANNHKLNGRVNSDQLRIAAALGDYYVTHGLMENAEWAAHYWYRFDRLIRSAQQHRAEKYLSKRDRKRLAFKKLRDFFKHMWRKLTGYYKRHGL